MAHRSALRWAILLLCHHSSRDLRRIRNLGLAQNGHSRSLFCIEGAGAEARPVIGGRPSTRPISLRLRLPAPVRLFFTPVPSHLLALRTSQLLASITNRRAADLSAERRSRPWAQALAPRRRLNPNSPRHARFSGDPPNGRRALHESSHRPRVRGDVFQSPL